MQKMQLTIYAALITAVLAIRDKKQHFRQVAGGPDKFEEITASDNTCYILWFMVVVGFVCQVAGQQIDNKLLEQSGTIVNLVGCSLCIIYAWQHGLMHGYMEGTIDPEKHNFCNAVGVVGIVMLAMSACICFCCVPTILIAGYMQRDREATLLAMDPHSQEKLRKLIVELEFKKKCSKAFKAADADGNGKLDLNELEHVSLGLFDIPDRLKDVVKEHDLFKQAFVEKDVNKDNFIDEKEFVEVMKWIVVKAASEANEAESEQITKSMSQTNVA